MFLLKTKTFSPNVEYTMVMLIPSNKLLGDSYLQNKENILTKIIEDIIIESSNPWSSPIVLVTMKYGSIVIDFTSTAIELMK